MSGVPAGGGDGYAAQSKKNASRAGRRRLARIRLAAAALLLPPFLAGCAPEAAPRAATGQNAAPARSAPPPLRPVELVWPTPNPAFAENKGPADFAQPTQSGEITSGLFGSVRSGGRQFHEGLDIRPLARDAKGEALDPVGAALAGVVRHVSARAGASSYGRYVVLEHPEQSPPVYTLYAHLAAIEPGVAPGRTMKAGERIGTMGRSAGGYTIPKERAHLHFEIGLRMTDSFASWYKRRGFGSPNEHGLYNGMNLMGVDPLDVFARRRAGGLTSLDQVFRELPSAVTLRIAETDTPDFVRRYPSLVSGAGPGGGWEIDFSATGVPVRWRRLPAAEFAGWKAGEARVLSCDKDLLSKNRGRDLVDTKRGSDVPGEDLRTVLEQLFGWRG